LDDQYVTLLTVKEGASSYAAAQPLLWEVVACIVGHADAPQREKISKGLWKYVQEVSIGKDFGSTDSGLPRVTPPPIKFLVNSLNPSKAVDAGASDESASQRN
jgi:hypothetical protein